MPQSRSLLVLALMLLLPACTNGQDWRSSAPIKPEVWSKLPTTSLRVVPDSDAWTRVVDSLSNVSVSFPVSPGTRDVQIGGHPFRYYSCCFDSHTFILTVTHDEPKSRAAADEFLSGGERGLLREASKLSSDAAILPVAHYTGPGYQGREVLVTGLSVEYRSYTLLWDDGTIVVFLVVSGNDSDTSELMARFAGSLRRPTVSASKTAPN